jgi:hypothetical protein
MKIDIEENVGLKRVSVSQYSTMSRVKYPADVTMNYAFRIDISDALSNFQYLTQSELPLINAQRKGSIHVALSRLLMDSLPSAIGLEFRSLYTA